MSCGLEMAKLKDFDKQLDEQATGLANQIQQWETQLATANNSYMTVLGAKELATTLIQEAEKNHETTAEVVPEASGD